MKTASEMMDEAIAVADEARRQIRLEFQEVWWKFWKCAKCGRAWHNKATCCHSVTFLTGYAEPPEYIKVATNEI